MCILRNAHAYREKLRNLFTIFRNFVTWFVFAQVGNQCDGISNFQANDATCDVTDDVVFSEGSVIADYVIVITLPEASQSQVYEAR